MKNLEQIQEENRKAIILANNPEAKDYDEALEMEEQRVIQNSLFTSGNTIIKEYIVPNNFIVGLGKPLTLDRVLIAVRKLNPNISFVGGDYANEMFFKDWDNEESEEVDWDLTKPTLEEQTEETQRAINKLLTK